MLTKPQKIAKKVIELRKLKPPINVFDVINLYAKLEFNSYIPHNFDGLCYFAPDMPHIIINNNIPESRKKFTTAHELGHILIPGHRSINACNLELSLLDEDEYDEIYYEYIETEKEANDFASELLLPEDWLRETIYGLNSYKAMLQLIYSLTELSIQAITIKLIPHLRSGLVIYIDNMISGLGYVFVTPRTNYYQFNLEYNELNLSASRSIIASAAESNESFVFNSYRVTIYDIYTDYIIDKNIVAPDKHSTAILKEYLNEIGQDKLFTSINGILANANGKRPFGSMTKTEYLSYIESIFRHRDPLYRKIAESKQFQQYIVKRYEELSANNKP